MNCECVMVFVRAPELGSVKTRLAKVTGNQAALELHQCFTLDMLRTLSRGIRPVEIWFHPPRLKSGVVKWLGNHYVYKAQKGEDLGEKMANAFRDRFRRETTKAILIGTDFPDLPYDRINEAFESLDTHDAVVGPSTDGGYYLIGFNAHTFLPDVFQNMVWGTERVFQETMAVFQRHHKRVHCLGPWRDIDTFDDLVDFYLSATTNAETTRSYLKNLDILKPEYQVQTK